MSSILNLSADLAAIEGAKIAEKNGKKFLVIPASSKNVKFFTRKSGQEAVFLNMSAGERKVESQSGETHWLKVAQSKEEREQRAETVWLGGGKLFTFSNSQQPQNAVVNDDDDDDGLPF